ncbi:MAG: phosphatase PAP2 family protein [Coriobacteriia bacterium]|nr:phosphatase PAP2 family protein [Coriobacteriia bacterium]
MSAVDTATKSKFSIAAPALAGLAVAGLCIAGYIELAEDLALSPGIAAFDSQLNAVVQGWRTPPLTAFFSAMTWSGSTLAITLAVLVAVAVLSWRCEHREALVIALVVASGTALGTLAKRVTERPRPPAASALVELPTSYAFPSGHTLAALLLWTVVAFAVLRVARPGWPRVLAVVGGVVITVLVGTSRVYLGVHWPTDVLASWLLGVAWLSLTLGGFLSWERAQAE